MNRHSAIALLEFGSIAVGTAAADAMVKAAPVDRCRAGSIQPGKHLVLVAGAVAAVEESYAAGRRVGADAIVDGVLLFDVHAEVHDAVFDRRRDDPYDALGIIETSTVAAAVRAADAAVKGAAVHLLELRLGDGLGGRGLAHLTGRVADVEAAIEIAAGAIAYSADLRTALIPQLHEEIGREIALSTRFGRPASAG